MELKIAIDGQKLNQKKAQKMMQHICQAHLNVPVQYTT